MTVEVAVLGIDGSGKSSNIFQSANYLGRDHSVLILGWKSITYIERGRICNLESQETRKRPDYVARWRFLAMRSRMMWFRLRKASLIKECTPAFCIEDRDLVLDPCILVSSYLPAIRKTPLSARVRFMKGVTGGRLSNVYVYLDISPEAAFERVCIRHRREGKKLSAHENLEHLRLLRYEYASALSFLQESRIPVCRVDTEGCTVEECSRTIADFIVRYSRAEYETLTPIRSSKK